MKHWTEFETKPYLTFFISSKDKIKSRITCSCGSKSFITSVGYWSCPLCGYSYTDEEFKKNREEYLNKLNNNL